MHAARNELQAAERQLERIQQDPLALRLDVIEAENAVVNAQNDLLAAIRQARTAAADSYYAALEARNDLEVSTQQKAIARTTLEATRIRFEAGAATRIELETAENELEAAQQRLEDTEGTFSLALAQLSGLLGQKISEQELQPITANPDVPQLDTALERLRTNTGLEVARQAIEIAELELAAVDNAFSSRLEIEQAEAHLEGVRRDLNALVESLELTVRQRHNQALIAQGKHESALAALDATAEKLNAQELRYESGIISQLELMQAQLDHVEAKAQVAIALHDLLQAIQDLETAMTGSTGN
ncbi:MAG TPA: TolC family protein [Trueperaceae bacterium]